MDSKAGQRMAEYRLQDTDRVLFLHLSKTAGTSFNFHIENNFAASEVCPAYFSLDLCRLPQAARERYRYFRGHLYYDVVRQVVPGPLTCMTMLREPVARFISNFNHLMHNEQVPGPYQSPEVRRRLEGMSIDAFVSGANGDLTAWMKDLQADMLGSRFYVSRSETDPNRLRIGDKTLPASADDVARVLAMLESEFAVVGLTERFDESLWLLSYAFGWPPTRSIRLNQSQLKAQADSLAPATQARIKELNAADTTLYDRATQLFEARLNAMTRDLLERFGSRAQAHATLPLPAEEMLPLLEAHYQERVAERQRSPYVFLNARSASPGRGWYLPSSDRKHGPVRWTGPEASASMDLRLDDSCDMTLKLHVISAANPAAASSLRLHVNGQPVVLTSKNPEPDTTLFTGEVSRTTLALNANLTRLTLEIDEDTFISTRFLNDTEMRQTGILWNWFEIRPASDLEPKDSGRVAAMEIAALRDQLAIQRDVVIGLYREAAELQFILTQRDQAIRFLQGELAALKSELAALQGSRFWKLRSVVQGLRAQFRTLTGSGAKQGHTPERDELGEQPGRS